MFRSSAASLAEAVTVFVSVSPIVSVRIFSSAGRAFTLFVVYVFPCHFFCFFFFCSSVFVKSEMEMCWRHFPFLYTNLNAVCVFQTFSFYFQTLALKCFGMWSLYLPSSNTHRIYIWHGMAVSQSLGQHGRGMLILSTALTSNYIRIIHF